MATIETGEGFTKGPDGKRSAVGEAERWTMEFHAARERLKKWHEQSEKILDRYLDERDKTTAGESRLNLFTSNVDSQHAMLYGQVPKVSVSRRFSDSKDDVARVAGEMLERLLNLDIERDGSTYASAIGHCLEDRLLPGFAFACVRYEMEEEEVPEQPAQIDPMTGAVLAEEVPATTRKAWENVETDYHYWKSVLWSPCRTFEDSRWWAWKAEMTRDALVARFGDLGKQIPMNTKTGKKGDADAVKSDPWSRADVWEIWCKEERAVYWFVEGFPQILDQKADTLGLDNFYPFPKPMIARPTTRNFLPRPDFVIAQDLYNEIDKLTTRINLLEDAVRVAGAYDKTSPEVAKLLTDSGFNRLYPAENWAAFSEKSGFKGVVDWFPLEQVTGAIGILTEKRAEKIALLQQVTGWSDIMRGQSNPNETLGAQKLKTRFGGVRVERFQREFAGFASDILALKAEIIAKHYDAETIIQRSNVMNTADAPLAQAAVQLIKSEWSQYRVEVKPEAISLTDFAQMKEERVEVVGALSQLFAAATPVIQAVGPQAAPFFLELGKWVLAGTKGSSEMEGIFDKFVEQAERAAQAPKPPPPPDPRLEAEKVKAGAVQFKAKADMAKTGLDLKAKQATHGMEMQKLQAEAMAERQKAMLRMAPGGGPFEGSE